MIKKNALSAAEIEYIADMLRATRWIENELHGLSDATREELRNNLHKAEHSLRKTAKEMFETSSSGTC